MKACVFAHKGGMAAAGLDEAGLIAELERVAETTDTRELVVALYLLNGHSNWKAHTSMEPFTREDFASKSKGWTFVQRFGTPVDLPDCFGLIRMAFGMAQGYPQVVSDIHGWEVECTTFAEHLAYIFAHELHHFRRYHLGMHAGEGEQSACMWALARLTDAGYLASGQRLPKPRRRTSANRCVRLPEAPNPRLLARIKRGASWLNLEDLRDLQRWARRRISHSRPQREPSEAEKHFAELRALPDGALLRITGDDPAGSYVGQTAVKVRTLRRNSPRMAVRTQDGVEWLWPMLWLDALNEEGPS
jgi:hypothetical protein